MPDTLDAVVIGAGFAGLHMLHELRERGFTVRVLEAGDGVGGTWYWNRYPGARVDVQSIEYSFSFSEEIQQEWVWTELMSPQPEIERYLNFVADRLDLRRDIQLGTTVTALTYDEPGARWLVDSDTGERLEARFVIAATGCLSAPLTPDIPGIDAFGGTTLFTSRFPADGFDFTGARVAVIGTGSSGVQSVTAIAEQADRLFVFQRSAAYAIPADARPLEPGELDELKAQYPEIRRAQRESFAGTVRFGAVSVLGQAYDDKILDTPMEERLRRLDELGWHAPVAYSDVMTDLDANRAATELYGEMIRRVVHDPETAAALVPTYPWGCKRLIIADGYYETFNRDNVTLVDLRTGGITRVTPTGIETEEGFYELDVIVFATGFDAMTGPLNRIDIRGRDGRRLRDVWADGPRAYLGLQVAGFPNLFTITGPGSPSVLSNMVTSIEQHVDWIGRCLTQLRDGGYSTIAANADAQDKWVDHAASLVRGLILASDGCNSWYLGANVPGKTRVYMPYVGGVPYYRKKCDAVAENGYEGFTRS